MMKQTMILALLLTCLGCEDQKKKKEEALQERQTEVIVEKVKKQEIFDALTISGFVAAERSTAYRSEVAGVIADIKVHPGEAVKKGQALFTVKPQSQGLTYNPQTVYSKINGLVTFAYKEVGEFVDTDVDVVLVENLSSLEFKGYASKEDVAQLIIGRSVSIQLMDDAKAQEPFGGFILSVSMRPDPRNAAYPVKARIDCLGQNRDRCNRILPGSYAQMILKQNYRESIRIETSAFNMDSKKAFIVGKDSKVKEVDVEVGQHFGKYIEITKGINPGDQLVLSYSRKPKAGEAVTIVEAKLDSQTQQAQADAKTNSKG